MEDGDKTKERLIKELVETRQRVAELEISAAELKRTEATLLAQRQLLENLVAVARATTKGIILEATLQDTLDIAVALTGADTGSLFLLNEAGAVTHSLLARGKKMPPTEQEQIVGRVMDRGLAGWVAKHRQTVLVPDATQDERWLPATDWSYTPRSVLCVPIISKVTLLGILTLTHLEPNRFTPEHVELMQAAADQMILALRNAQVYEAQRRLAGHQITLYEFIRTVGGILDPEAVIHVAAETIAQLTGWTAVAILVPTDPPTHLIIRAAAGGLSLTKDWRISVDASVTGRAFRIGQPQYVPDVSADPDYVRSDPAFRSELAVPIQRGEQMLGVLNVESDQPAAFDTDDVLLAESLAEALALAMANARFHAQISQNAEAIADERSRLRALLESSRDGIIMIGTDRRILIVNTPAVDLLKLLGRSEDWTNRAVQDFLMASRHHAADVVRTTIREMRRVQRGDEAPGEGEYEIPPRIIHWLNLPVMTGTIPLGRLVVLRDVTEERTLEKMHDDLTHTMVHDLRNPLGNISGSLKMLERSLVGNLSRDQQQMFEVASGSAQRMLRLISAILDISRLENGKMSLQRSRINLSKLIANALQAQAPLAASRELRLESDVPATLPPAWGDISLIERVLQNLIDNAVKFTPRGGVVRVTAGVVPAVQERIVVSVSDTGSGIPPELQERLFRKFARGRRQGSGSGLGLAFCKMAVEAHGERLWIEKSSANGTTFSFTLPVFATR